ncbi:hypothetical protein, partial [Nocardia cyriacigeorgica]|uniref:hypothetical protein n=1 Tax=Nocardia cyriacigeorgica TaxID=135487 RepID=UPI0013D5EF33
STIAAASPPRMAIAVILAIGTTPTDPLPLSGASTIPATAVGPGGIVLVEICQPFYAGSENPDIPIEVWPPVKAAI